MLVVTRKPGEKVLVGQRCIVEVVGVERGVATLAVSTREPLVLMPGSIELAVQAGPGGEDGWLSLTRRVDDKLLIGADFDEQVEVLIVSVKGEAVRLGFKAPRDVQVYREEVWEEIRKQNLAAARAADFDPASLNSAALKGLLGRDAPKPPADNS